MTKYLANLGLSSGNIRTIKERVSSLNRDETLKGIIESNNELQKTNTEHIKSLEKISADIAGYINQTIFDNRGIVIHDYDPIASAGGNYNGSVGKTITLNGSRSRQSSTL